MVYRGLSCLLCCLLAVFPSLLRARDPVLAPTSVDEQDTGTLLPEIPVSENLEVFRGQLVQFVSDLDLTLTATLQHPALAEAIGEHATALGIELPLSPVVYEQLENISLEELETLHDAFQAVPGVLSTPAALQLALTQIPEVPEPSAVAGGCTDVYTDFNKINSLIRVQNGTVRSTYIAAVLTSILKTVAGVANAGLSVCESPIDVPLSWSQIPTLIILGVIDLTSLAIQLAGDELGFQIIDTELCINVANCPPHGFTERFRPEQSPTLVGKGCDNRDNNCTGGLDETAEDRFGPEVSIDAALTAQCFRSEQVAASAATLAVRAEDDCVDLSTSPAGYQGTLDVQFTRAGCFATVMATATDRNNNTGAASAMMIVDDQPPTIMLQDPGTCQPTVEAARAAFGLVATDDCTVMPAADVSVVEKECEASFEFAAEDSCGNRSSTRRSVRLDDSPPRVEIDNLLLPDVDGLYCFDSEAAAVNSVAEATRISDNCDSIHDLSTSTGFPGGGLPAGSCDGMVVSSATDSCGLASTNSLDVRVDGEAPTISCTVDRPVLWPANKQMRDVGFTLHVDDNCDGSDLDLEVQITSDEPTSFLLPVHGADDMAPDAEIDFIGGRIDAIRLRAERQQTEGADGRVYRIRVVATDSCGLSSATECFVAVPKVFNSNNSQVTNSGQLFDATEIN